MAAGVANMTILNAKDFTPRDDKTGRNIFGKVTWTSFLDEGCRNNNFNHMRHEIAVDSVSAQHLALQITKEEEIGFFKCHRAFNTVDLDREILAIRGLLELGFKY